MLECGTHEPHSREAAKEIYRSGKEPTKLHCNCSGKHLGMMAAIKAKGMTMDGYSKMEHELQNDISRIITDFCRVKKSEVHRGVDGCGIPVYAIPLRNMAISFANLCSEEFLDGKYRKSQNYVLSAMTLYPEMVAGKGRFDTEMMKRFGDRLISKMGAEGVYCAGLPGKGIGIALKIEDGASRAIGPVILEALVQMGIVKKEEAEQVKDFWRPAILNHRNDKVGEIRPILSLK
jgi:L-asparaginase II